MNGIEEMNIRVIINYLLDKLEKDLTDEGIIYSGNVLFSDLDRVCEQVVRLFVARSDLIKNVYRLNIYVNLNWKDNHFDLVNKQTNEFINLVRKETNR